jgi:hypothetical protein
LQAGGHRFDPGWLHQFSVFTWNLPRSGIPGFRSAVSFIRLLFNNSEEVKRIRFSQTGFVWVVIALLVVLVMRTGALYTLGLTKRFLWF